MIDLQTKIHDKFTLEFKVGFIKKEKQTSLRVNDFVMNTWIFIPNSLDINKSKYSKEDFYRDIKTSVRLITPPYSLHDLANNEEVLPYCNLKAHSLEAEKPEQEPVLRHAIKMYCAIMKSATRDAMKAIAQSRDSGQRQAMTVAFLSDVSSALKRYRVIRDEIILNKTSTNIANALVYGDEFLSNILEQYGFRLRDHLRIEHPDDFKVLAPLFKQVLKDEKAYKKAKGYLCVSEDNDNTEFVYHASLLKKFAEGDLFLEANKSHSTFVIEQIFYSAAAGVAMIFATVASFFFQQKYGNFTFPFLVALVISYMFKDRLKDWLRILFAARVSPKVFDTKTCFRTNGQRIGWSKESFDFISDDKVPEEVLNVRSRTTLFNEVSGNDERIILYRKKVRLYQRLREKTTPFPLKGINEHIRFNITEFLRKMDNPVIPLLGAWEDKDYALLAGAKTYFLHFVIQCTFDGQTEYKHITVVCNRNGILEIK